ncbi:MAG: AMP-binding protein [Butyrivibrio sp.]|nr:AMP-binding protein [Butyrivibrio sp.]
MINQITDYLELAADKNPDKKAYIDENSSYSYIQMKSIARMIADALYEYDNSPVALFLKKSVDCIACMFGVAYSRNFYTVLDTDSPLHRLNQILDNFNPSCIITDIENLPKAKTLKKECKIIVLEEIKNDKYYLEKKKEQTNSEESLLCVIYTSGSTGIPKGVAISHRAVINYIEDASVDYRNITSDHVFGNQYPFYYIAAIDDIYLTVRNIATMVIIPKDLFYSPSELVDYLAAQKINTINWVPSALRIVSEFDALGNVKNLAIKKVIFGGEEMKIDVLNYWIKAIPDAVFINGYGATETTEGTTYYVVDHEYKENESMPIGIPLSGVKTYILDEKLNPVEDGHEGELFVESRYMSNGYYNDAELTSKVFLPNPFESQFGNIIYKTGDMVRKDDRGNLILIGRADFQIKRNGHRINLLEIEKCIFEKNEVKEKACVFNKRQEKIYLFYVGSVSENELYRIIKERLPVHMVPNEYRKLSELPKNANGKIDRKKLSEMSDKL